MSEGRGIRFGLEFKLRSNMRRIRRFVMPGNGWTKEGGYASQLGSLFPAVRRSGWDASGQLGRAGRLGAADRAVVLRGWSTKGRLSGIVGARRANFRFRAPDYVFPYCRNSSMRSRCVDGRLIAGCRRTRYPASTSPPLTRALMLSTTSRAGSSPSWTIVASMP